MFTVFPALWERSEPRYPRTPPPPPPLCVYTADTASWKTESFIRRGGRRRPFSQRTCLPGFPPAGTVKDGPRSAPRAAPRSAPRAAAESVAAVQEPAERPQLMQPRPLVKSRAPELAGAGRARPPPPANPLPRCVSVS